MSIYVYTLSFSFYRAFQYAISYNELMTIVACLVRRKDVVYLFTEILVSASFDVGVVMVQVDHLSKLVKSNDFCSILFLTDVRHQVPNALHRPLVRFGNFL